MELSDLQFEAVCKAVVKDVFVGSFDRLLQSDTRTFPKTTFQEREAFKNDFIQVLLKEAERRELHEVAEYLAHHWADNDSPKGEYSSSSSPLTSSTGAGCERCKGCGNEKTYANQVCMPINGKVQCIDWCIHGIVAALNAGGVATIASCCGHGQQQGRIELTDGMTLWIDDDSL